MPKARDRPFAMHVYTLRKPKPWRYNDKRHHPTNDNSKPTKASLLKVVRYLKCMNASSTIFQTKEIGRVRRVTKKNELFPFLQRNLEACVNSWSKYEQRYNDWMQKYSKPHKLALRDIENSRRDEDLQETHKRNRGNERPLRSKKCMNDDNTEISTTITHKASKPVGGSDIANVMGRSSSRDLSSIRTNPFKSEPCSSSHQHVDHVIKTANVNAEDELNRSISTEESTTMLKSFYAIYHICELQQNANEAARRASSSSMSSLQQPLIEELMDSKLVKQCIDSPPIGGLRMRRYATAKNLQQKTYMTLERWRHAQKPTLLPEPDGTEDLDSGAESETGMELWNRKITQLHHNRKVGHRMRGNEKIVQFRKSWANFDDVQEERKATSCGNLLLEMKKESIIENPLQGTKEFESTAADSNCTPEIENLSFESVQSMPVKRTPFRIKQEKSKTSINRKTYGDGYTPTVLMDSPFTHNNHAPYISMASEEDLAMDKENNNTYAKTSIADFSSTSPLLVETNDKAGKTSDLFVVPSSTSTAKRKRKFMDNSLTVSTPDLFAAIEHCERASITPDCDRRLTRASSRRMNFDSNNCTPIVRNLCKRPASVESKSVSEISILSSTGTPRGKSSVNSSTLHENNSSIVRRSPRIQVLKERKTTEANCKRIKR